MILGLDCLYGRDGFQKSLVSNNFINYVGKSENEDRDQGALCNISLWNEVQICDAIVLVFTNM